SELTTFFSEVFETMQDDFNQVVLQRLNEHKNSGYIILIVSGAFTKLLKEVNNIYPVDKIIRTELPSNGQSMFDDVHAERKVRLIREFFQSKEVDWQESAAYGDSIADLSVLELVGHPVAVNPDEKLKKIAHSRDWEIL